MRLVIGEGSCGIAAGAHKVRAALEAEGVEGIGVVGCIGMCFLEPIVDVYEGDALKARLVKVKAEDAPRIAAAVKSGTTDALGDLMIKPEDRSFLEKQTRIALRNCGVIDPESIESYRAIGGYAAIAKILSTGMTAEDVIEEIKISGLAGRGGAGFPTWFKWNAARQAKGDEKYLICNADEGDPGAFMDRAIIEGDPHSLIEGMLIAAYAIGASKAFVYVRAEYPLAIKHLSIAIDAMKRKPIYDFRLISENSPDRYVVSVLLATVPMAGAVFVGDRIDGVFSDMDVAMAPHPSDNNFIMGISSLAVAHVEFRFKGSSQVKVGIQLFGIVNCGLIETVFFFKIEIQIEFVAVHMHPCLYGILKVIILSLSPNCKLIRQEIHENPPEIFLRRMKLGIQMYKTVISPKFASAVR